MPLSQARSRSAPNAHHAHTPKGMHITLTQERITHTSKGAHITPMVRKDLQPTNPNRCPFAARPSSLEPNIELTRQGLRLGISIPMLGHDRSTAPEPIQNKQDRIFVRSLLSRPLHGHDSLHDVKMVNDETTASAQRAGTLVSSYLSTLSRPPFLGLVRNVPDGLEFSRRAGKIRAGLGFELGGPGPI